MGKVKFIECTLEEYNSLETKDSDTLYFISNRNIIYKGELPFPDSVTSTKDGIMSTADKTKLDGIEEGATALPSYTEADNGKFLQIVDGVPTWVSIENAEGVSF